MTWDFYHCAVLAALATIIALQLAARRRARIDKESEMAQFDDINALIDAMNTETTRIADKVAELVAQVSAGGMTADQEAQVQAALAAELDKLKAIGADPANPVP